jgi:DNA-binding Xre family transcriptional regulator
MSDLADVPEPWRSIRLNFRQDLEMIMQGYVPGAPPVRANLRQRGGERLRVLRKSKGWTQKVLAEKAGYSAGHIGELEAGCVRDPRPEKLRDICRALGCEVEDIWS